MRFFFHVPEQLSLGHLVEIAAHRRTVVDDLAVHTDDQLAIVVVLAATALVAAIAGFALVLNLAKVAPAVAAYIVRELNELEHVLLSSIE